MEFNGFNTKMCRESNAKVKQNTKAVYLPLIDMHPAEYDTVLTTMVKVRELTRKNGQKFSVVTFDQQLYNLAIHIQWDMIKDFPLNNFFIRLSGMYTLMNFVGAIGTFMSDSGLSDILSSTFAEVARMLTGKKYPQCLRALRMVVEIILNHSYRLTGCHATKI